MDCTLKAIILAILTILVSTLVPKVEAFEFDKISEMPLQLEIEYSVITIDGVEILYLALTDKITNCKTICYPQGFHLALAHTDTSNYFIGGFDFFVKITGGNIWQRWGLGLSIFDRQNEQLDTPWDIHASMQSGWNFIACSFHHWSNGRGGAEKLNLEKYWPNKNDGANAVTCGFNFGF